MKETDLRHGNRVWIELLHAEGAWLLAGAGIDALVIKGPSLAGWLYPGVGRDSVDVDLLIRPSQWSLAIEVLSDSGFSHPTSGLRRDEEAQHAIDLQRHDSSMGLHMIDLHHSFPGFDAAPDVAFRALWERRVRDAQAGVDVWFPDLPSRLLIVALHAARDPREKSVQDLRLGVAALTSAEKAECANLAGELDALPVLRAALDLVPEGAAAIKEMELGDVLVPAIWTLRSQEADPLATLLEELSGMPLYRRPKQVAHWLFPSPSLMRRRGLTSTASKARLVIAYGGRALGVLPRLPKALRQRRAARLNQPQLPRR